MATLNYETVRVVKEQRENSKPYQHVRGSIRPRNSYSLYIQFNVIILAQAEADGRAFYSKQACSLACFVLGVVGGRPRLLLVTRGRRMLAILFTTVVS